MMLPLGAVPRDCLVEIALQVGVSNPHRMDGSQLRDCLKARGIEFIEKTERLYLLKNHEKLQWLPRN